MIQLEMKSASLDYTWTINGEEVNETVYHGMNANATSKFLGSAARSFARIPFKSDSGYRLATYIFCDFAWDLILTENLNVFVAANYYNSSDY